jgi:hypothetical protein
MRKLYTGVFAMTDLLNSSGQIPSFMAPIQRNLRLVDNRTFQGKYTHPLRDTTDRLHSLYTASVPQTG